MKRGMKLENGMTITQVRAEINNILTEYNANRTIYAYKTVLTGRRDYYDRLVEPTGYIEIVDYDNTKYLTMEEWNPALTKKYNELMVVKNNYDRMKKNEKILEEIERKKEIINDYKENGLKIIAERIARLENDIEELKNQIK